MSMKVKIGRAKKTAIALALLWGAVFTVAAGEIFVDAAASADAADGSAERPYVTIQDAVDNAQAGDTIKVAAGVYSAGDRQVSNKSYARVYIENLQNLKLIGAGRGKTIILGSRDPAAVGSNDSRDKFVRCVYVKQSNGTIIEGFTLKDGETIVGNDSTLGNRNGGGLLADSTKVFIVDCDIVHCCARTGAGIYKGTAVRCRIDNNHGLTSVAAREAALFNCIVTRNRSDSSSYGAINQSSVYNCTIFDNDTSSAIFASSGQAGCTVRNSIIALSGDELKTAAGTSHDVSGCVRASAADKGWYQFVAPLFDDYRLLNDSQAIGAGNAECLSSYELPEGVEMDLMKDFNGAEIVPDDNGRINAGAIQATVTPAGGALAFVGGDYEVNGVTNTSQHETYVYPEVYPTQYCVRAVLAEGEELYRLERYDPSTGEISSDFQPILPQLDGRMWLMPPLSADMFITNKIVKADHVIWVDKALGNDSWGEDVTDAGSAGHPYATIQKAVDNGISGNTVIKVCPGNYDAGVTTNETYGTFRLHVESKNVRIVAVDGPVETVISGAPDPVTADNGTLAAGLGTNAVKCVYMSGENAYLQGFTLANGYTGGDGMAEDYCRGSAIISKGSNLAAKRKYIPTVLDCVISNCHSAKEGIYFANLVRSRFTECVTANAALIGGGLIWGCYGGNCEITCGNVTGFANNKAQVWQSTFVGKIKDGKVCSTANVSYNSIYDGGTYVGGECVFTNCIVYNVKNYNTDVGYRREDPLFVSRENDGVLRSDSPAVGMGYALTDCDFAEQFWRVAGGDINGNPLVFTGGKCTVGAFQTVSNVVKVAVPNSQTGGWALAGEAQYGENLLYENGDSLTIVPTAGNRPCVGVTLAGRNYLFTNHPNETITFDYASLSGLEGELTISGIYTSDWYVDDDGDDSNTGFLPTCPKRTLATAAALLQGGDTLWVFPGTYDQGDGNHSSNCSKSRVVVKANTSVISLKGAEETIIKGAEASKNKDGYGNGIGAVRCAHVGSNGLLKGFTLTGGRVDNESSGESYRNGAAVFGASANSGSTVSDCIISNNVSVLGTIFKADVRNCLIISNITLNAGAALRKANAYNCYITKNQGESIISLGNHIWSTTVADDNKNLNGSDTTLLTSPEPGSTMFNSLFQGKVTLNQSGADDYCHMSNCVCSTTSTFNDKASTGNVEKVDFASQQFVDGVIPVAGANAAVDAADESLCPGLYAETDLRGFQRKMNGRIDIGAYEADWRGVYAMTLCSAPNALTVESASSDVVKDGDVLKINSGSIAATWRNATGKNVQCVIPVQVTGGGVLTVTLDDEELGSVSAADGEVRLSFMNKLESQRLVFAYTPAENDGGAAIVGSFTRSRLAGLVFSVR